MILARKLIEGNLFVSEKLSGVFDYEWQEILQAGFEQVVVNNSVIEGIDAFWHRAKNSYSFARWELNALLISIVTPTLSNYNLLTPAEKQVVAKHLLLPYFMRLLLFTDEQDIANTISLLEKTKKDRESVVELMRKEVYDYVRRGVITQANSVLFSEDLITIINSYIISASPKLKLFIEGEFITKPYYNDDLKHDLMYIYNYY